MGLCNDNTNRPKAARYSAWSLKNLRILPENIPRDLGSRRELCWYYVCAFENTPEMLILKYIIPLKVAATLLSGSRNGAVGA